MESAELHTIGTGIFAVFKDLTESEFVAWANGNAHIVSEEQRFRLWAHSLGLHQTGHASLDYRVRDVVVVKAYLVDVLRELKENLDNLLSIVKGERQPFESAAAEDNEDDEREVDETSEAGEVVETAASNEDYVDSSVLSSVGSSESSFRELDYRLERLSEIIDALYSLATKIRHPRNRPQRTAQDLYKHIPKHLRHDYIREREEVETALVAYVQQHQLLESLQKGAVESEHLTTEQILDHYASPANYLIRRTGAANARRKQQCLYWKEHAERISRGPTGETVPVPAPNVATSKAKTVVPHDEPVLGGAPTLLPAKSLATSATRLDQNFVKLDDLRSVISHQSRVSTVMNLQGEKLEWPPPPIQTVSAKFFTCPYCKIICPRSYLEPSAWR
jgi:hypothetical protein